jgi:hypothetical protein
MLPGVWYSDPSMVTWVLRKCTAILSLGNQWDEMGQATG